MTASPEKIRVWSNERKRRNRAYIDAIRARTVCEKCGAQPIHWHRPLHAQHPTWRVGFLAGTHCSLGRIDAEIAACQPLCPACHVRAEAGGVERIIEMGRKAAEALRLPPRPCSRCPRVVVKIVKGMCPRCYKKYRGLEMTEGWVVVIFREGRRYAFVAKTCVMNGTEFSDTSACTEKASYTKRWKTEAGARKAAEAYSRNNPGVRCQAEPFYVGGRCIHGGAFPCAQCNANRRWSKAATSRDLTEDEFASQYRKPDLGW